MSTPLQILDDYSHDMLAELGNLNLATIITAPLSIHRHLDARLAALEAQLAAHEDDNAADMLELPPPMTKAEACQWLGEACRLYADFLTYLP